MKRAIARLESLSPYSQSKYYQVDKHDKESDAAFEARTWRERMHYDLRTKRVYIPPMAFANCVKEAAKFLSLKIKGRGTATYTKHFEAGIMVVNALELAIIRDDVEPEWLFVPSDGRRGGGKRVQKCFPRIESWDGEVEFHILDDTITEDIFRYVLEQAGLLIGIGRFRPRNCGFYGRFKIVSFSWFE